MTAPRVGAAEDLAERAFLRADSDSEHSTGSGSGSTYGNLATTLQGGSGGDWGCAVETGGTGSGKPHRAAEVAGADR